MKTVYSLLFVVVSYTACISCDKNLWLRNEIPNPRTHPEECGRQSEPSNICDPNHLLDVSMANQLDKLIERVKTTTKCMCSEHLCQNKAGGAKIAIAIVEEMMTTEEADGGQKPKFNLEDRLGDAALFAQYLHSKWGIDQCGDGILIFYSAMDHVLFTHTGREMTKTVTNKLIADISMQHRSLFQYGPYHEGFDALIRDYAAVLHGQYKSTVYAPQAMPDAQMLIHSSGGASSNYVTISLIMLLVTLALHF